jgi:DNA-binding Xre family transcriptional regulator
MNVTINNRFGILLAEKQKEERRNIPLAEVSEKTGISRRALYAWENNKVNRFDVPVINALCGYFNIQPGELFEYVPDPPEQDKPKTKTSRK